MPKLLAAAAVIGVLTPASAWAQSELWDFTLPGDWTVTIGAGGQVLPAYDGSDRYILAPFPTLYIRRAGTPRRFTSPRDGISLAIVNINQFRFGPTGRLVLPRNEDDDAALRGLGNVDWALEIGVFAEYWVRPWLRTRAEVRQGFGGHDGIVSDVTADFVLPASPTLTLSAGPRLTLATAQALQPYFGVDTAQSVASGLPVYYPGGGIRSFGFGAQARQQWFENWSTNLFLEYDRLVGDAAHSPILARNGSANQMTIGLGVSYSFDISLH